MGTPATAGLDPVHFRALITDSLDGQGVIKFNQDLALEELTNSSLLVNARIFLKELSPLGGIKATTQGNLLRKFVMQMVDAMVWPDGYVEDLRWVNKVLNEIDVYPLHVIRVLLELAGLIHKVKGTFRVKAKHKQLLKDDSAGELYALLFKAHFNKFNLAYLDRVPGVPLFQHSIAYPLFMLLKIADAWHRPEELAPRLLLPQVMAEIPSNSYRDLGPSIVQSRLIKPLVSFGLLEEREVRSEWEDVDFARQRIRLYTRKRKGGNLEADWVDMTDDLTAILREHRKSAANEWGFVRLNKVLGYLEPFCVFRGIAATQSGPRRPLNPEHSGHPFRSNPAT